MGLNPIIFSTVTKKFPPAAGREFFENILGRNRMKS
jgi:hypothetical protein